MIVTRASHNDKLPACIYFRISTDPFSPYMFPAVVVTVAIVTVLLLVSLVSLARRLVKRRSCIEETADSVSTTALSVTKSCPSNIKSHSVQDTPVAVQIYFKQFQNSASS